MRQFGFFTGENFPDDEDDEGAEEWDEDDDGPSNEDEEED